MRNLSIFTTILLLSLTSCEEIYEGDERYVIQGQIVKDGLPYAHKDVEIYSSRISENHINESSLYTFGPLTGNTTKRIVLSAVQTDENGNFTFGIPGADNKIYYLKIDNQAYGYLSKTNMKNYYYHTGTIDLSMPIQNP